MGSPENLAEKLLFLNKSSARILHARQKIHYGKVRQEEDTVFDGLSSVHKKTTSWLLSLIY